MALRTASFFTVMETQISVRRHEAPNSHPLVILLAEISATLTNVASSRLFPGRFEPESRYASRIEAIYKLWRLRNWSPSVRPADATPDILRKPDSD
jgi:hypothetical protein